MRRTSLKSRGEGREEAVDFGTPLPLPKHLDKGPTKRSSFLKSLFPSLLIALSDKVFAQRGVI